MVNGKVSSDRFINMLIMLFSSFIAAVQPAEYHRFIFKDCKGSIDVLREDMSLHHFSSSSDFDEFCSATNDLEEFINLYSSDSKLFSYIPKIVVIEGLDGCGKSTLASSLAADVQSQRTTNYRTPPDSLKKFRSTFDKIGGLTERAFYMVMTSFANIHPLIYRLFRLEIIN